MNIPTSDLSSRFALDTKGLGELKQSAKAAEMYRLVADNWPDDEHAPDAMLARAEIIDQAGQHKEARMVLAKLVAKYPSSDAARQAKIRLKKK